MVTTEQPELVTAYSVWIMLQDDVTVFIEEQLMVAGEAGDGSWTGTFRYEPEAATSELLAQETIAE